MWEGGRNWVLAIKSVHAPPCCSQGEEEPPIHASAAEAEQHDCCLAVSIADDSALPVSSAAGTSAAGELQPLEALADNKKPAKKKTAVPSAEPLRRSSRTIKRRRLD